MENLNLVQWIPIILGILLALSELLPFTDKVKSNGLFQGIIAILKSLKKK